MKTALITGIAGFCGGYLARHLHGLGVRVCGLDVRSDGAVRGGTPARGLPVLDADMLDGRRVMRIVKHIRPDVIFHLAALSQDAALAEMLSVNVIGTANVLEAAMAVDAKVLISGSAAEYGRIPRKCLPITEETAPRPVTPYGVSKLAQTTLGQSYFLANGAQVFLSRAFNIIGPGQGPNLVCSALAQQVKNALAGRAKATIRVGNLTPKRDFIDVRDVVRAYCRIVAAGKPGEIYNVCSGRAHSVKDVLDALIKIGGLKKFRILQTRDKTKTADIPESVGDMRKLHQDTGWRPVIGLEQTLTDLLR